MKKIVPVLTAVSLIILISAGFVGFRVLERYMPTKERADLAEVYHVSGDETAIIYNYAQQEQTGIYENGQTYLPISWVNDHINERSYWDSIFLYMHCRIRLFMPMRRQRAPMVRRCFL